MGSINSSEPISEIDMTLLMARVNKSDWVKFVFFSTKKEETFKHSTQIDKERAIYVYGRDKAEELVDKWVVIISLGLKVRRKEIEKYQTINSNTPEIVSSIILENFDSE